MKTLLALLCVSVAFSSQAKNLKIMQYNAENFFDTYHDNGTEDWTYLPLALKKTLLGFEKECAKMTSEFFVKECLNLDWNDSKFFTKAQHVAQVIKGFDKTSKGPDIVVMEEIENQNVLEKLVSYGLSNLGYNYKVLIEGDDTRGIDVGVISKYPVLKAKHYSLMINGRKLDTRGILEVVLKVGTKQVTVLANHWPSQSNPVSERVASAELLSSIADHSTSDLILALGDFNTLSTESPYPFNYMPNFIDAETEARKILTYLNPGTHFYKGEWTSLDHIFIHKKSMIKPLLNTFQILDRDFLMTMDANSGQRIPYRFDHQTGQGYSDHLGLGLEFDIK